MAKEIDIPSYLLGKKNGGGSGTSDYDALTNKPKINNVTVQGDLSLTDLGINIPSITYGTTDLTPGVSTLSEGAFYFVYE